MWEMDAFIMEKFSTQASVKRPGKLEQLKPGQELEGGRINAKKRQQITSGNVFCPQEMTFYSGCWEDGKWFWIF